jgi:hypothetical protein
MRYNLLIFYFSCRNMDIRDCDLCWATSVSVERCVTYSQRYQYLLRESAHLDVHTREPNEHRHQFVPSFAAAFFSSNHLYLLEHPLPKPHARLLKLYILLLRNQNCIMLPASLSRSTEGQSPTMTTYVEIVDDEELVRDVHG